MASARNPHRPRESGNVAPTASPRPTGPTHRRRPQAKTPPEPAPTGTRRSVRAPVSSRARDRTRRTSGPAPAPVDRLDMTAGPGWSPHSGNHRPSGPNGFAGHRYRRQSRSCPQQPGPTHPAGRPARAIRPPVPRGRATIGRRRAARTIGRCSRPPSDGSAIPTREGRPPARPTRPAHRIDRRAHANGGVRHASVHPVQSAIQDARRRASPPPPARDRRRRYWRGHRDPPAEPAPRRPDRRG